MCALVFGSAGRAQFTYSEDFKNSTAAGWVLNPAGNSTPNVTLTSGTTARSGDPEPVSSPIDASGSGWLRLTNNTVNTHNAVYFDTPIPSAGNSVTIQFGANLWGGNNFNSTGADGLTFFLYDASKPFQVGADGGSMGYAQKTGVNGLNGGFVAVALDAYGNFSVQAEGRDGGTTTLQANSVAVRGPGQGTTGYSYLAGTGNRDYTDTGAPATLDAGDGTVPALPYTMAYSTATARPNQSTQYRNVSVTINESSQLAVSMQFGEDGLWYNLLNVDLSSFVRPEQLKLGFSAGTGSGTMITEVGGLLRIDATAGSGNFIWDNGEGPGSKIWGTGATNPLNWAGNTNPTLKSNVIFNSTYISSAQNIDVTGSDKVITNLYFSGANSYTLTSSESRKLIFDTNTAGGLTAINLTNEVGGNTSHAIGLDIQMNQNLDVNNNLAHAGVTPDFTITGNIDNGGNVLGLKGAGSTVLAGEISGAGSIVKSDDGIARITGSGVNSYSGTTTVNGGILQIEKASALGSTVGDTTVNAGGTLALAGGVTFDAEALTINGSGVGNAGALRSVAGANTWTGTVALGSTGTNTIGVDAGSLTLSGVISGATGNNLVKVGDGTATFSAVNTYSGSTTIDGGTIAIGADSGLGTAPVSATAGQLALNGGTLQTTSTMTLDANRGIALGVAGGTLNTDASTTLTYNGIAAGSGNLTKSGGGTLVMGGTNTYTGTTNIAGGTFTLGANNVVADASAVVVASGATFNVNGKTDTVGSLAGAGSVTLGAGSLTIGADNTNVTFSGVTSGTGNLLKTGTGTATFSGLNTFTGNLQINQGTVTLGADNAFVSGLVLNGGTLAVNGKNDTFNGLSLLATSSIDYNSLSGVLGVGTGAYTAGGLTINNWAGSPTGGGASQLLVNSLTAFNATFLSSVTFMGYATGAQIVQVGSLFEIVPLTGASFTWGVNANGNWTTNANWSPTTGNPNGIGQTAVFGSAILANRIVTLDAGRTVGYLIFNDDNNYTISPSTTQRITMDVTGGNAQINLSNTGSATLTAGLTLNDNLTINQNSAGTLTLSATNAILGTNKNVTVAGSGNTTISGTITTGTGSLTKNNAGTLTLGGANTYSGGTNINGGTIKVSSDGNLGATSGGVTLNGGTLENTASFTLNAARSLSLGAIGGTILTDAATTLVYNGIVAGAGAFTKEGGGTLQWGGAGANTHTGSVTVNAGTLEILKTVTNGGIGNSAAVTVASGGILKFNNGVAETIGSLAGAGTVNNANATGMTLTTGGDNTSTTFSGTLQNSGGALALSKAGTGTFTLSGANTYTGQTTVSAGTLAVQNTAALGGTGSGTTVQTGATLALDLAGTTTIGSEALTISGTGVGNNGALRNINGNTTWSGTVTLAAAAEIQSETGATTLLTNTAGVTGLGVGLTIDGAGDTAVGTAASGTNGVNTGLAATLTKNGTGTLTLAAGGNYTGATTINAGTVAIQNNNALGTTAAGTTIANGATLALSNNLSGVAETLSVSGQGIGGNGALRSTSGTNTLTGAITLNSETYLGVDAGTLTIATGGISGATYGITKVGAGTLDFSVANSYGGTTAIAAGTLQVSGAGTLGSAANPTTVADGATLVLNSLSSSLAENITITGTGNGAGVLQSVAGTNTLTGNVSMTGNSTIGAATGTSLVVSGNVSGAYDLAKTGAGSVTLAGTASSYTGTTTVRNGNLTVSANSPVAGNGALGNTGSPVQIGDNGTVAANNLALLIGGATGGISVDRAISVNNFNTSGSTTLGGSNSSGTNTFNGNIGLARSVNLEAASGGAVVFNGAITGMGGVTKTGAGNVTLTGSNNYDGATTISAGTLVVANAAALGATTAGTTVNSGATLGVQGNVAIAAGETLTVSGTGAAGVGAVNNVSGNNTISAPVTLAANTTIGAAAGTLTLAGVMGETSGARDLATTGAGNLNFTAASSLTGAVTIGGTGITTLANTSGQVFGSVTSLTISSGATLALGASNQINDSATLTLAGGTFNVGSSSEVLRQLNQTAASAIDYLNDGSILRFNGITGSSSGLGSVTGTLTIANWAGSLEGGGTEQLVVYSPAGAPTVSSITFADWGAATTIGRSDLGANFYEIVPTLTATYWHVDNATQQTWNNNTGTWSTSTGATAAQPNAQGAVVILGDIQTAGTPTALTNNPIIDVDGAGASRTIGKLIFENSANKSYTLNSSNGDRLDFDVASGQSQIIVNDNGAHTINAPVRFNDATLITNNSDAAAGLTLTGTVDQRFTGDLTFNGAGTTRITGAITQGTGTTNLVKTGSGTLQLANNSNTYLGTTTVRNGTLQVEAGGALGTGTSAIVVNDASTTAGMNTALLLGASGITLSRAVTVGSQGAATTLGGNFASGNSNFSGAITLNRGVDLAAAGTSNITFSGQLAAGTGTSSINKTGTGTVILGNTANNYNGTTDITAGTLRLGAAGVITDTSAVTVAAGATLDLNGFSETVGSLAGAGNVNGTAGANTLTAGQNNSSTTFSGIISDGAGTLALTKTGTGTLTLTGANTYDGATTVSTGTLVAGHNTALGTAVGATSVTAGATLGLQGSITITGEAMTLNSNNSSPSTAALANLSGTNVSTGAITLTAATANDAVKVDVAGGSLLTLSGAIGQSVNAAVLSKSGTGTLVLSGANTYAGLTNVAAGTLVIANNTALGATAGGTSVQIGATLGVQNNVTVGSGESYILYGTVVPPSAPSIKNIANTNTLQGAITLVGGINTGVAIDSNTGSLTLDGAITQATNPNYVIKTGAGDLTLGGAASNTFSGGFTINDGRVIGNKSAGNATGAGAVNIGDGIGNAATAILQLNATNQISDSSAVAIQTDGRLDLQGNNDTIGALTMSGGNVQGTGVLTLGNNFTFNGVGAATAMVTSNLDLGSANLSSGSRIVQVGNNGISGDVDLSINGAIGGGATGFKKTDLGTLELAGSSANTFSGTFQVADGTVLLNKTAGQNATGSGAVTIGDGSGAANTATLKLLQSEQIANTRVTIASDGKFDVNGLTETIGSFAGAGTIATGTGGTGLLIAGGDNTGTTFSGALTGDGTIRKTGVGTLTFDQSINFSSGTLELNGGTVALGTMGSGITLNVGTLRITGVTVLDFGNSAASTLNATNLFIAPGGSLTITNWVNDTDHFYAQNWNGAVLDTRGQGAQLSVTFTNFTNTQTAWLDYGSNKHEVTPAPEPATYGALMIGAAFGVIGYRRWRNKQGQKAV